MNDWFPCRPRPRLARLFNAQCRGGLADSLNVWSVGERAQHDLGEAMFSHENAERLVLAVSRNAQPALRKSNRRWATISARRAGGRPRTGQEGSPSVAVAAVSDSRRSASWDGATVSRATISPTAGGSPGTSRNCCGICCMSTLGPRFRNVMHQSDLAEPSRGIIGTPGHADSLLATFSYVLNQLQPVGRLSDNACEHGGQLANLLRLLGKLQQLVLTKATESHNRFQPRRPIWTERCGVLESRGM